MRTWWAALGAAGTIAFSGSAGAAVNLVQNPNGPPFGAWSQGVYVDWGSGEWLFGCRTSVQYGPCFLSQMIATTPGQTYAFGATIGGPLPLEGYSTWTFMLGSAEASHQGVANPGGNTPFTPYADYHDYSGTFTAISGEALLILTTPTPVTSNYYARDFYVREAAIPEPATWAVLILGFFAVGGEMRRRAAKAARGRAAGGKRLARCFQIALN